MGGRRVLLFICLSLMTACSSASKKITERLKIDEPVRKAYLAKYEDVEAAIKQAMIKYPVAQDNTEAGIFETDYVKGDQRFRSPLQEKDFSSGYRYKINIRLVRGKAESKPAVIVLVTKKIELARDFFGTPERVASDGLEEDVILYRIGREIAISRAISKANEKANQAPVGDEEPTLD